MLMELAYRLRRRRHALHPKNPRNAACADHSHRRNGWPRTAWLTFICNTKNIPDQPPYPLIWGDTTFPTTITATIWESARAFRNMLKTYLAASHRHARLHESRPVLYIMTGTGPHQRLARSIASASGKEMAHHELRR